MEESIPSSSATETEMVERKNRIEKPEVKDGDQQHPMLSPSSLVYQKSLEVNQEQTKQCEGIKGRVLKTAVLQAQLVLPRVRALYVSTALDQMLDRLGLVSKTTEGVQNLIWAQAVRQAYCFSCAKARYEHDVGLGHAGYPWQDKGFTILVCIELKNSKLNKLKSKLGEI